MVGGQHPLRVGEEWLLDTGLLFKVIVLTLGVEIHLLDILGILPIEWLKSKIALWGKG